jgi:hypothetical protein
VTTLGQLGRVSIVGAVDLEDRFIQVASDGRNKGTWNGPVATTTWLAVNSASAVATTYAPSRWVSDATLALSLIGRSKADTYDWRYLATSSFDGYLSFGEGKAIPGSPLYCAGVNNVSESHRDPHTCPISEPASRITLLKPRCVR